MSNVTTMQIFLDKYFVDSEPRGQEFFEECKKLLPTFIIDNKKFSNIDPSNLNSMNRLSTLVGSIRFVRDSTIAFQHSFFTHYLHYVSKYISFIPQNLLWNKEMFMLPLGLISTYSKEFFEPIAKNNLIYIKPDNALKISESHEINLDIKDLMVNDICKYTGANLDSSFWVAPMRKPVSEYRLLVYRNQVPDYSLYLGEHIRHEQIVSYINQILPILPSLTEFINENLYVVDIGIDEDGNFGIIELNTFATSGKYNIEPRILAKCLTDELKWVHQEYYQP